MKQLKMDDSMTIRRRCFYTDVIDAPNVVQLIARSPMTNLQPSERRSFGSG